MSPNDQGKSPWGKQKNQPDLEEFLNNFQKKMQPMMSNVWLVGALLLLVWGISGIFIVSPREQAAVLRFGKLVRVVGPGPNYHLPYPIEEVMKERVTEVKRLEMGFRTINAGPPAQYRDVPRESLMLTGDESIVGVEFIVQYIISDLEKYLFNVLDVHDTVRMVAESAMREVVGQNEIDTVLTEGKAGIEVATKELIDGILKSYEIGVSVQNVKLQDVQPPDSVAEAFKSVASAREERARLINEAEGYRNDLLPRAQGEAEQMINQARSYKLERVNTSRGETKRFLKLLQEYRKAPGVTRERIRIETMEHVLPGATKMIVDPRVGKNLFPVMPFNQKGNAPQGVSPEK
ncbi:MAG: FtsH protease activity modulator HflK [Deltaproteobacteria bacterium]|nr:FtsH protease activity modulator HflK [Deltaproteobacteria bacterium]